MIKIKTNKYPWFKYYKDMKSTLKYPDTSMYELVKRACIKYPSNIAYSYFGTKVTYKSLLRKIDLCAQSYAKIGVVKNSNVTICSPNTPEAIISFYALNKIGAVVNMLHPLSSEEEIKFALNLTKCEYLFIADIAYSKFKNIRQETSVKKVVYAPISESMDPITKVCFYVTKGRKLLRPIEDDIISYTRFIALGRFYSKKVIDKNKGDDVSVILHSGGTTGIPKGIMLTNMNFNSLVFSELEINKVLGDGVSILAIMPIFHGFGLGCTFHACLVSGGHAIILPSVDPKKFDATLLKYRPNIIACVPSILETLTYSKKLKDEDLSFIKCIICGGDNLSTSLNKKIDEFLESHNSKTKVRTAFGMTEATAGVTMMPLEESRCESIGVPIPDSFIKIVKPGTEDELKPLEIGEICISGPTVMKGYLNNKKETDLILKKHKDKKLWLHSGDLGYMDSDGFVYFKSRLKRMIVSSGYNIYPGQIEEIISSHPYVKTCAVVGVPHPYKKEVIKAYIVLKDNIELTSEVKRSIKSYCEKNIASYSLPYAYGYRKELPKTLVGKVAYRKLLNDEEE